MNHVKLLQQTTVSNRSQRLSLTLRDVTLNSPISVEASYLGSQSSPFSSDPVLLQPLPLCVKLVVLMLDYSSDGRILRRHLPGRFLKLLGMKRQQSRVLMSKGTI